jgi:hypothetical protein
MTRSLFQVEACAPGLNPDWRNWDPRDALETTRTAMKLAQQYLGVEPVIFLAHLTVHLLLDHHGS